MSTAKAIIACKIFENEINAIQIDRSGTNFHWLDAALHADPDQMEEQINNILHCQTTSNNIRFLMGNGCHPNLCGIAKKAGADLPAEKNCIHAFLGEPAAKEIEKERTMIISPGWIDAWPGIMEGLGWDETDVRINLGRYDRMLLLDPEIAPLNDEKLIEFFDLVQVPIETMRLDLTYFNKFVETALR